MRPLTKHHARQFFSFLSAAGIAVTVSACSFHASAGAKSSANSSSSSSSSSSAKADGSAKAGGSAKADADASAKSSSKASAKSGAKGDGKMSASASIKAGGDAKADGKSKAKVVAHSKPPAKGMGCATDKKDDFKASVVLKGKGKISVKAEGSASASGSGKAGGSASGKAGGSASGKADGKDKNEPCGLNKGDSKDCGKHLGEDKERERKNPPAKPPEPEETKTRERKHPPSSPKPPPQAVDPEPQEPIPPPVEPPENDFGYENPIRGCFEGLVYPLAAQTKKLPTDWSARETVSVLYACEWDIATRSWSTGFPGVEELFEWFAIRYTGSFAVQEAGEYEFRISSDDGAKLYIDGQLVIDNDGEHPPKVKNGKIRLTAGDHDMVLEYFQGPRYHINLQLYATPPGGEEGLFTVR